MIQVRVDSAFRDAEGPQTVNEILLPVTGNDNLVQHIFIAYVLQLLQGVVDGEIGMLGVHSQVIFRGTAGQNAVHQFQIVMVMFKSGQQHLLGGIRVDGIDAAAEALHLV